MSILCCLICFQAQADPPESLLSDPLLTSRDDSFEEPCRLAPKINHDLSLIDIVNQALCQNPQTRQAWANARYQAAQLGIAKSAYLPTLNLNTSLSRSLNSSSSNLQSTIINPSGGGALPQNRATPILSIGYLLYNFGGREAQLENAQRTLEASHWTHDSVLQNVMLAAIQAYYQVFATQSAANAATLSEQASLEALHAAQKRREVGAGTLADVLQAQTAFAQASLNHKKTEGDAKIAQGNLANAIGLQASEHLKIAEPGLQKPDAERDEDVRKLIDQAKTMRPDLAAAEANVKAAEAQVDAAKAGHLPSLSLVGNYGFNYTSLPSQTESWTLGMQISMPLFNGFNTTYQIRSAKEQLEVQKANLTQLDQSVSLDVWRSYHSLMTAQESFKSSEDLLESAAQSEKVSLGRYKAGAGNIIDLLNAQASLANARLQNIQAQYDWLTQKAQLAKALGRLDLSNLETR